MEFIMESLKLGIIPSIIVACYLIISKLLDNKKESNQAKVTNQLVTVMDKISYFIDNITNNIIANDKDKCKAAVRDSFNSSAMHLVEFACRTIINNNIESNKDNILSNLHNLVKSEYYTIYSTLSLYTINGSNIANILKDTWIKEIENNIEGIIYNTKLNNDGKVIAVSNRIISLFGTYITYINNNGIK